MLTHRVLYRSRSDRMVAGVCGGLGHYLDIDPAIIRLVFVLLTVTAGIGLPIYIMLAIIMPTAARAGAADLPYPATGDPAARRDQRTVLAATALIAVGGYLLLEGLGMFQIFRHDVFWPLVLVAIGVALLARRRGYV